MNKRATSVWRFLIVSISGPSASVASSSIRFILTSSLECPSLRSTVNLFDAAVNRLWPCSIFESSPASANLSALAVSSIIFMRRSKSLVRVDPALSRSIITPISSIAPLNLVLRPTSFSSMSTTVRSKCSFVSEQVLFRCVIFASATAVFVSTMATLANADEVAFLFSRSLPRCSSSRPSKRAASVPTLVSTPSSSLSTFAFIASSSVCMLVIKGTISSSLNITRRSSTCLVIFSRNAASLARAARSLSSIAATLDSILPI
mmetsp:Transcript_30874/g.62698  ORF Transcript_30874/g.62698 Transcript_30874/m.62698 type:complete len:261 (+) Transcript_30874:243-1025(+)